MYNTKKNLKIKWPKIRENYKKKERFKNLSVRYSKKFEVTKRRQIRSHRSVIISVESLVN